MSKIKLLVFVDPLLTPIESINNSCNFFTSKLNDFEYFIFPTAEHISLENIKLQGTAVKSPSEGTHLLIIGDETTKETAIKVTKANMNRLTVRHKQVPVTRVINVKRETDQKFIYIGRGTTWGNSYSHLTGELTREEAISNYEYDLNRGLLKFRIDDALRELRGETLGCSCKPLDCHGDVLCKICNDQPFS